MTLARPALIATALAATALVIPLAAQPAYAAPVPGEVQLFLGDNDNDGGHGIYRRNADGTVSTIVPERDTTDDEGLSASADGTRYVYSEYSYDPNTFEYLGEKVIVRDISGRLVRVVAQLGAVPREARRPLLDTHGTTVAWTLLDFSTSTPVRTIQRVTTAAGSPTTVSGSTDADAASFLDDATLIVGKGDTEATLPLAGGTTTVIQGDPEPAYQFLVSPDRTQIVFTFVTSATTDPTQLTDIRVAPLSFDTAGKPVIGTPRVLYTGTAHAVGSGPKWSVDGSTVSFIVHDPAFTPPGTSDLVDGPGDIWSVPADGNGTATVTQATPGDENFIGTGLTDTVPPSGQATPTAITPNGTSATVRWTLPDDATVDGVKVTRTSPTAATKTFFASGTSVVDTGLVIGTEYDYAVAAADRSDNVGPTSAVKKMVATAPPALAVSDPTSSATTSTPFTIGYSNADKAGTVYSVDYRRVGSGSGFVHYNTTTARANLFGSADKPVKVLPGQVFEFRGSAKDSFGNTTATVVGRTRAVVPFDQTRATFVSTAATVKASYRWLGTSRVLSKAGQIANLTGVYGNRLQVVGDKSTSGGSFAVYLKNSNGSYTKLGSTVSTYAASSSARQVLYSYAFSTAATRTYQLRWVVGSTSTRKNVVLDAFAVRQ